MARQVGLFDAPDEARLAVCQARLGNPEPAKSLLERRGNTDLEDLLLAELHLALGDRDKARHHTLLSYQYAWGEGEPYANFPWLQDCRRVLAELGESEPKHPPFDPSKATPVRFEPELRAYIEKLKKKKAEEEEKAAKEKATEEKANGEARSQAAD